MDTAMGSLTPVVDEPSLILSIPPPIATTQPEVAPVARKVLDAILEALPTSCNTIDDIGVLEATRGASEWLSSCRQSYLDQFHCLWPILHMPTFDETREPLILGAIVVIIGASLHGQTDKRGKELITTIYEQLADRLSAKMLSPEATEPSRPWPIEVYQAVLLIIILACYCQREGVVDKALLLHRLFVAVLRELSFFSTESLAHQEKTYFSEDLEPYRHAIRETWKRLVTHLYKADTCLSLLRDQPPLLLLEDLDVDIPSTFSLWNTGRLHVYYKRRAEEPTDRYGHRICRLALVPMPWIPATLLVEDIQLGLYALLSDARRQNGNGSAGTESKIDVLEFWRTHLDRLSAMCGTDTLEFPLKYYAGDEDQRVPGWETTVISRVQALIREVMVLYHLVALHLHADVATITSNLTNFNEGRTANRGSMEHAAKFRAWTHSAAAKTALWHAVAVLKMTGISAAKPGTQPFAMVAASTSAAVLWAVGQNW